MRKLLRDEAKLPRAVADLEYTLTVLRARANQYREKQAESRAKAWEDAMLRNVEARTLAMQRHTDDHVHRLMQRRQEEEDRKLVEEFVMVEGEEDPADAFEVIDEGDIEEA